MAEHEAVQLGLGQLERARLLDRVLRGDGQKRGRQAEGRPPDGHAAFLHRFQQGRLHLGRGAVDFVGQQDVGEDRAAVHVERGRGLVEDLRAEDVGRQEVDRELHAAELQVDGPGHGADQQRLGQSGHALQEQVSAGEQRDQHALDHLFLTDDDLAGEAANVVHQRMAGFGLRCRLATNRRTHLFCLCSGYGTPIIRRSANIGYSAATGAYS